MKEPYIQWLRMADGSVRYEAITPNVAQRQRRWLFLAERDLRLWFKTQSSIEVVERGPVVYGWDTCTLAKEP